MCCFLGRSGSACVLLSWSLESVCIVSWGSSILVGVDSGESRICVCCFLGCQCLCCFSGGQGLPVCCFLGSQGLQMFFDGRPYVRMLFPGLPVCVCVCVCVCFFMDGHHLCVCVCLCVSFLGSTGMSVFCFLGDPGLCVF